MEKNMNLEDLMELGNEAFLKKDYELSVKYYRQAADAGETDAMAQIGIFYQSGQGVEQSFEKAIEWYHKILDAGNVDGWYLLGTVYEDMEDYEKSVECYERQIDEEGTCKYDAYYGLAKAYRYGLGKEENFAKALDYYQQAAGNGVIMSMVDLGQLYYEGDFVKQDYSIANYWFEKAANSYNGNYLAFAHLGEAYHHGLGKEVNYDKAKEYYEKAMDAGEDAVLFWYGEIYFDEEQYKEALNYFQRAAVDGNEFQAEAENTIGIMYQQGKGVEQDFVKAAEWYQKAAGHGNASAMCALGTMYNRGQGMAQDCAQAAYWALQAAKLGDVVAMYNIGSYYEEGNGVEQDYVAALAWYMRAADYGDEDAMNEIGDIYYFGNGVERDYSIAKEWFEKAIAAGNETPFMPLGTIYYYNENYDKAMELYLKAVNDDNTYQHIAEARIGDLYLEGSGVEQDMAKAAEWYEKSAAHGYATAMLALGDIYCDGEGNVEQDLTKAKEWYEKAKATGSEEAEQRLADLE
ncbi:tetratricopeptide repeat protein [Selenomonas ruminantium]|uniref:tetratricopeptide repeat protein n=1 Tax=Selenomonas ruminantium TaxID=971 RepID=UPI000479FBEA|nr:tetratricopeptide repeat protein [Selenomonas ruminantium]